MPLKLRSEGLTHKGMKRETNEDSYGVSEEERLFLVADGMGGHNSGEIASKIAVETATNFFRASSLDDELTWPYRLDRKLNLAQNRLRIALRHANARIWEIAQRNIEYHGMGTTSSCLYFEGETAYVGHVGDSRVYLSRGDELRQLTEDHSLLAQTAKAQQMTKEQIARFKHKNVLVRALGILGEVEVDLFDVQAQPGDRFILCSDGLHNMVKEEELHDLARAEPDLKTLAQTLIDRANQAGGSDNITVVLVEVSGA